MGVLSFIMGMGCESLSPEEVKAKRDGGENFVLLDVRTPGEYAAKRIKGAKHVPLQELGLRYSEVPKDKDVVVYCQNGIRSIVACKMLKKMGYDKVRNMSGGISRW